MNTAELFERIVQGENSRTEFERDDCDSDALAATMAALMNDEGGVILLGVDDDGQISGLTRGRRTVGEWVMNCVREKIQPIIFPHWTCFKLECGKEVGVIELNADRTGKPYKARQEEWWVTFTREGSAVRMATRGEERQLYLADHPKRFEFEMVSNTGLDGFDMDRIQNYYQVILNRSVPDQADLEEWQSILLNSDLLVEFGDRLGASVAGCLLFGDDPNRQLPQAGVTAVSFPEFEKEYNTVDEEWIRGPLTSRYSERGTVVDKGVIDRALDFVKRNMRGVAWLEGGRRCQKKDYPIDAVREAIINAVSHRDYAYQGTDIEVSMYCDRMEIISPGRLPNGVTLKKMREGVVRLARNKLLKEILRDYDRIESRRAGVHNGIIESMQKHNGTEPELIENDHQFIVRLWKRSSRGRAPT